MTTRTTDDDGTHFQAKRKGISGEAAAFLAVRQTCSSMAGFAALRNAWEHSSRNFIFGNIFVNFEIFVVFGMKYHDEGYSEKGRKDEKERKSLVISVIFVVVI